MNEINAKLLHTIKQTFSNTTYTEKSNKVSLHHAISIISMASQMGRLTRVAKVEKFIALSSTEGLLYMPPLLYPRL